MIARIEPNRPERPNLVLAHPEPCYRSQVSRQFHQLGWEVHQAESGAEVRRLARLHLPAAVVLAAEAAGESGWLTCAKLRQQAPGPRIILVDAQPSAERRRFTDFVGGTALVSQDDGVGALIAAMGTVDLPAVG